MKPITAVVRRDEEAVTAAVGTVLLFAGVLSIVGVMMATMIPVIEELEGAVERSNMVAQMSDLANELDQLASRGMPGDMSNGRLSGVEGRFSWQNQEGGVWISASWQEGGSLRLADALDLDRRVDLRYPNGEITAVCFDDMRLGQGINDLYRIPAIEGRLLVMPDSGLAQSQGPLSLSHVMDSRETTSEIPDDEMWSVVLDGTSESWLSLDGPAQVLLIKSEGGTSLIPAQSQDPATMMGRTWRVPLPQGYNTVTLVSEKDMGVDWRLADEEGSEFITSADSFHAEGTTWSRDFIVSEDSILNLQTTNDAHLVLSHDAGDSEENMSGQTNWPSTNGVLLGQEFILPGTSGTVIVQNPSSSSVTLRWGTGATSVGPQNMTTIPWPPQGTQTPYLRSEDPISIMWTPSLDDLETGLFHVISSDTTRSSGHKLFHSGLDESRHHVQIAGVKSNWTVDDSDSYSEPHSNETQVVTSVQDSISFNASTSEDPIRVISESGDQGMINIQHDGMQRCKPVGIRASGWISVELPWEHLTLESDIATREAWIEGAHPASMKFEILGPGEGGETSTLSTAWAVHAPRLVYQFSSSIEGLEVATRAGAVVTNHPEVEPQVIRQPTDRTGPGPRFALSIPLMTPSEGSESGSGSFDVDLELAQRLSLASASAHEVRRGWDGPYGAGIAAAASKDLRTSDDWTAAPMRLDLLDDYRGWVPHPSLAGSETIYHADGDIIQFSLQVVTVSCNLVGA